MLGAGVSGGGIPIPVISSLRASVSVLKTQEFLYSLALDYDFKFLPVVHPYVGVALTTHEIESHPIEYAGLNLGVSLDVPLFPIGVYVEDRLSWSVKTRERDIRPANMFMIGARLYLL